MKWELPVPVLPIPLTFFNVFAQLNEPFILIVLSRNIRAQILLINTSSNWSVEAGDVGGVQGTLSTSFPDQVQLV